MGSGSSSWDHPSNLWRLGEQEPLFVMNVSPIKTTLNQCKCKRTTVSLLKVFQTLGRNFRIHSAPKKKYYHISHLPELSYFKHPLGWYLFGVRSWWDGVSRGCQKRKEKILRL
ncbi:unnamed protein product [Pipistrellus nathusii]|uniref:Uncharacterized protein n=1 Tax=Pipistrellus nathusii TaxID=59473 RepID=A0ABP0A342_PIPNA